MKRTIDERLIALHKIVASPEKDLRTLYEAIHETFSGNVCAEYQADGTTIKITYRQYNENVIQIAGLLRQSLHGIEPGEWIAFKHDTHPYWFAVFWGILMAGYNVILMDYRLDGESTRHMLRESSARAIVCSDNDTGATEFLRISYEKLICPSHPPLNHMNMPWANQIALCTSGTIATSKIFVYRGVEIITQLSAIRTAIKKFNAFVNPNGDKALAMLPLHHIFGFHTSLWHLIIGSTLVYIKERTPKTILETCRNHRITWLVSVPLFWEAVVRNIENKVKQSGEKAIDRFETMLRLSLFLRRAFGKFGIYFVKHVLLKTAHENLFGPRLRICLTGGGHISGKTLQILSALGFEVINGYGATEMGVVSGSHTCNLKKRLDGTVGIPMEIFRYAILHEDQETGKQWIEAEGEGELIVRGEALHFAKLEHGARVEPERYENIWFRTGDVVRLQGQELYILSRTKDVIINESGENIYPDDLESYFTGLPDYENLCVLGLKGGSLNDLTALVLAVKDYPEDSRTINELAGSIMGINEKLPVYKRVHKVLVSREAMPLSNGIKVRRLKLREMIEKGEYLYRVLDLRTGKLKANDDGTATAKPGIFPEQLSNDGWLGEKETIQEYVKTIIAGSLGLAVSQIPNGAHIVEELQADSLTIQEMLFKLEKTYGFKIPESDFYKYTTVETITRLIYETVHEPREVGNRDTLRVARERKQHLIDDTQHDYLQFVNPAVGKLLEELKMAKSYTKGQGCRLYDNEGNVYLDCIAAYGALPFGYNDGEIWKAVMNMAGTGEPSFVQPSALNAAGELARKLIEIAPGPMRYVTFTNSGAETAEAAIKLCRAATGKKGILAVYNSFHGKTLGALSATGNSLYQKAFGAPIAGFNFIKYGDLEALKTELERNPSYYAAMIIEPIQGEGGIVEPPAGYLRAASGLCRKYGVAFIVDEIQSGLGRTGKMFACEEEGVEPDVLLLAKALGGGLVPIGACLYTDGMYSEEFALRHSSTFAGNTLACRVAIKVLDMLQADEQRIIREVKRKGNYLKEELLKLQKEYPDILRSVRGRGFMLGIELGVDLENFSGSLLGLLGEQDLLAPILASYLLDREKLRVAPTLNGGSVIRIEPPLVMNDEECERIPEGLKNALKVLSKRDTARFLSHLIDSEATRSVERTAYQQTVKPHSKTPAGDESNAGRFAFLIHPLDTQNYLDFDSSLTAFSENELEKLSGKFSGILEPSVVARSRIVSNTGAIAEGEFILIPKTAQQLMDLPEEEALKDLKAAITIAKNNGAKIVGLGAFTSIVSNAGQNLMDEGIALTTGNSYTVVSAVEATWTILEKLQVAPEEATIAVVGATGSIGRGCSVLFAEMSGKLMLFGNSKNPAWSLVRLQMVVGEICRHIAECLKRGDKFRAGTVGHWISHMEGLPVPEAPAEIFQAFISRNLITGQKSDRIILSTDLHNDLQRADVIICATNNAGRIIEANDLKPGAVVCDLSRPHNIGPEVEILRPDVLLIDGGVIEVPGKPDFGINMGYETGLAYACMSETMLLALEKQYCHTSLGSSGITVDTILRTRDLAKKHGFRLAGFKNFDRPLSPERWDQVIKAREIGKEPASLKY